MNSPCVHIGRQREARQESDTNLDNDSSTGSFASVSSYGRSRRSRPVCPALRRVRCRPRAASWPALAITIVLPPQSWPRGRVSRMVPSEIPDFRWCWRDRCCGPPAEFPWPSRSAALRSSRRQMGCRIPLKDGEFDPACVSPRPDRVRPRRQKSNYSPVNRRSRCGRTRRPRPRSPCSGSAEGRRAGC